MPEKEEGYVTWRTDLGDVRVYPRVHEDRFELAAVEAAVGGLTADLLRAVPVGKILAWLNGPQREKLAVILAGGGEVKVGAGGVTPPPGPPDREELVLSVPNARPKPDGFFAEVAERYGRLTESGNGHPAVAIAEANDVPVATVRGWIREARKRGCLGAATKGVAR